MQLPRNVRDGLVVFLVGIIPLLYTISKVHSHKWDVLNSPLVISPGQFKSPSFSTDLNGTYVVSLAFDHMPDFKREECLVGWNFRDDSCKDIRPTLDFDWTAIGDVSGIEHEGHFKIYGISSGGDFEVLLGTFEAKRGGRQEIVLNVLSDSRELNNAHPRLKVQAHHVYWEKWVIVNQMAWLVAFGAGLAGTFLIFWPNRTPIS